MRNTKYITEQQKARFRVTDLAGNTVSTDIGELSSSDPEIATIEPSDNGFILVPTGKKIGLVDVYHNEKVLMNADVIRGPATKITFDV